MIFKSDKFFYDGVSSEEMGVVLVDTKDRNVLMDYGVSFKDDIKVEHSFGSNPFFTHKDEAPDRVTLEFCLIDSAYNAISWSKEIEEKVINWLMKDRFCEFVSYDYPDLFFYFRGVKVSRRRNHEMKGILEVEFQPYYKYPIQKLRKKIIVNGEKDTIISNISQTNEYVYPIIEITALEDGDIQITNKTVDETNPLIIKKLKKDESIKIDNRMYIVTGENNKNLFHKINRNWFKLSRGDNEINIKGNAKIKINCNLEIRI